MKVFFDYLSGPVLGHKQRCAVLMAALRARGHSVSAGPTPDCDWSVIDYPQGIDASGTYPGKRLLMDGSPTAANEYAWAPLSGVDDARVLVGKEYLLLDPLLAHYNNSPKRYPLTLTCGGQDPYHITERMLSMLPPNGHVVLGAGFGRQVDIPAGWCLHQALSHEWLLKLIAMSRVTVCTFGQTVFEGCFLGSRVLPITLDRQQEAYAATLGIPYVTRNNPTAICSLLAGGKNQDLGLDLKGGERVVRFMEGVQMFAPGDGDRQPCCEVS